jgi:hypothetical protein
MPRSNENKSCRDITTRVAKLSSKFEPVQSRWELAVKRERELQLSSTLILVWPRFSLLENRQSQRNIKRSFQTCFLHAWKTLLFKTK